MGVIPLILALDCGVLNVRRIREISRIRICDISRKVEKKIKKGLTTGGDCVILMVELGGSKQ
jgi:hypothetical protein